MQLKAVAFFAAQAAAAALPQDTPDDSVAALLAAIPGASLLPPSTNDFASSPDPQDLQRRDVCNADNALRNLRDKRYSASASDFCSIWIQSTVVNTAYAIETDEATVTQTPDPVTLTSVVVEDQTVTTSTQTVTKAVPTLPDPRYNQKRDGSLPYPTWLSASYPPDRVSSACSCFITAPSPAIQQTVTVTTSTETHTNTQTLDPVTTTITQLSTQTIGAVATQTVLTGLECGIGGCLKETDRLAELIFVNLPTCKFACSLLSSCKSFSFSSQYGICILGKNNANDTYKGPGCKYHIYDRACTV